MYIICKLISLNYVAYNIDIITVIICIMLIMSWRVGTLVIIILLYISGFQNFF